MFYLVAIIECLGVGFLVTALASSVCLPASRLLFNTARHRHPGTAANLLFTVRILPAGLAVALALLFALPAFLLFEPHPSNDYIGPLQLTMAALGGLLLAIMIARTVRVLRANSLVEKHWKTQSNRTYIPGIEIPTYCVSGVPSLFVVAGLFRPCVFVGREIIERFSAPEMAAAAAHEMAHIHAHDNFKLLLLEISRPPAWLMRLGISDDVWMDAADLAADRSSLAAGNAPLHLASALLKVGRLRNSFASRFTVSGSHLLPAHSGPCLETRVTQLVALADGDPSVHVQQVPRRMVYTFALAGLIFFVLSYATTAHIVLRFVEGALDMLF